MSTVSHFAHAPEAVLVLADGRVFRGTAIGHVGRTTGEVVFNTSMSGYQEILSDPSYCEQIITFTYPEIGNVGANPDDDESTQVWAAGLIIKELSPVASNYRATLSLDAYLKRAKTVGISDIDTRALVRHIRDHGAQMAILTSDPADLDNLDALKIDVLKQAAKQLKGMTGRNLVDQVTCKEPYHWDKGLLAIEAHAARPAIPPTYKVIAYDFGMKRTILNHLVARGCDVTVVPANTTAETVLAQKPDGVFLSNGPGDPAAATGAIESVRQLIGKVPLFGICLGHQILALALGAGTYKLKFGHRGGNHPVRDETTGKVEISSQNHGFAVAPEGLPKPVQVSHINLNDHTVEGIADPNQRFFSVQYHPEASAGPNDSNYLFDRFIEMMGVEK